jgi:hypothetical protein
MEDVAGMIFITPGVGDVHKIYKQRYGDDVVNGKTIVSSDGITKIISKEFMDSSADLIREEKYAQLLDRYSPVHVYEAGDDEIVGDERYVLRDMPFASYTIIKGAKHNLSGKYSEELFRKIDQLFDIFTAT